MRKIYSLVLMAAALLVGTNAWATIHDTYDPVNDEASVTFDGINFQYGSIYEAFDAVGYDGVPATIKLLKSPIETTKSIILYVPASLGTSAQPKNITLDMNGCNIQTAATDRKEVNNNPATDYVTEGAHTPFLLFRGTLNITGSGEIINRCTEWHISSGWTYYVSSGITVFGSIDADDFNFANLTVGKDVTIRSFAMTGIGVYATCGYDQVKGEASTSGSLTYTGITISDLGYNTYDPLRTGYGININVYGTVQGEIYGMYMTGIIGGGTPKAIPTNSPNAEDGGAAYREELATKAFPRVFVHSGAQIKGGCETTSSPIVNCNNKTQMGIYSSGWGIWQIEGYVSGATGAFIKSGDVTMNNATIVSCYEGAYIGAGASNVGGAGAGSAVVINSSVGGYAGNISVSIEGDTQVKGTSGNAIEEKVTTSDNTTNVNVIDIESGTFETTGNQPAITVDPGTTSNPEVSVTVAGGNWQDNSSNPLLVDNAFVTTTTNEDGKTVYVVGNTSETGGGSVSWDDNVDINAADVNDYVKLTGSNSQTITGDRKIAYLTMAAGTSVTIPNGKSLTVGEVVLNWTNNNTPADDSDDSFAKIIVEPGGKLIVTGDKGVVAYKAENIVLGANATKQALFVISPDVSSNKQPYATVAFTPTCYKKDANNYYWQRFSVPVIKVTAAPTNDALSLNPNYYPGTGSSLLTYVKYLDDATETWKNITAWTNLRIFQASSIANNTAGDDDKHVTYTFKGQLIGNVTDSISLKDCPWNYYGNGFMAPISIKALLGVLGSQPVRKTIYKHVTSTGTYIGINETFLEGFPSDENKIIPAMGFFVVRNTSSEKGTFNIDYANTIYNFAVNPSAPLYTSPARSLNNASKVCISVESESGVTDAFYMIESNRFDAEFEDGADMEKLMNLHGLNIYATDENSNYSMVATDNMVGTLLSMQTVEDVSYTLTFSHVGGEVYALRDNLTNAVVLMNEGATYNFTAQSNATLEGRFQIVSRQEMPTAVETVEETINTPKAVYTVMGQYVGETNDWNNLPAGVYVVDGVKVIK